MNKIAATGLMLLIFIGFCMDGAGSIILINGHGSVGKSSINRYLEKLFIKDTIFISLDDHILWPHARKEAMKLGLIYENMNLDEEQKILMECRYKIIDEMNWLFFVSEFHDLAKSLTQKYRYVILDTVLGVQDIDVDNGQDVQDFLKKMEGINIFTVFVYASPSVHAQHLVERNALPGYENKRPILSMKDFFCMYKIAQLDDEIVDILTWKDINKALDILSTELRALNEKKEVIDKKIIDMQECYQRVFFVANKYSVPISAHFGYDMIVNTGNMSSYECAQLIYQTILDHCF